MLADYVLAGAVNPIQVGIRPSAWQPALTWPPPAPHHTALRRSNVVQPLAKSAAVQPHMTCQLISIDTLI